MIPINNVPKVKISSPLLSGLTYALIYMTIGTLLTALLLFLTSMQESSLLNISYIIHGISLFAGGMVSGKRSGQRGWYHGGILGIIYSAIILIIGFLTYDSGIDKNSLILLIETFLCGALGGILGVNSKK